VTGYSYPFGYYSVYSRGFSGTGVGTSFTQYVPSYYSPSVFRPSYGGIAAYAMPMY
jgi:hypothetical protein